MWRYVTRGGGGRFLPKIAWHHLWTASYGLYTKNIRYTKWQVLKGSIFNAVAKSVCNPVILLASMPCTTCCFFCFYWPAFRRMCVNTLTMDFTSAHKQINLIKLIILKQTRRKQTLWQKSRWQSKDCQGSRKTVSFIHTHVMPWRTPKLELLSEKCHQWSMSPVLWKTS